MRKARLKLVELKNTNIRKPGDLDLRARAKSSRLASSLIKRPNNCK